MKGNKASPQREYQIKHRLTGAVIMVSVAVLVIPWLLSEPSIDANATRSTNNDSFTTEVIPFPAGSLSDAPSKPKPALLGDQGDEDNSQKQSATKSTQQAAKQPAKQTTQKSTSDTDSGWTVRVGTFSQRVNADAVVERLGRNGYTARKIKLADNSTLIWLGPYSKKTTAGEVSNHLRTLIGEKGYITKHVP